MHSVLLLPSYYNLYKSSCVVTATAASLRENKWANLASSSPPFPCQRVEQVVFFQLLISQMKQNFSFGCAEVTILFLVRQTWSHLYMQPPVCSECRGDPPTQALHIYSNTLPYRGASAF